MSLVRVLGPAGSGKTESCEILEAYGFECFDIDRDGLAVPRNFATGEIASHIGNTEEWWTQHGFELDEDQILAKKAEAAAKNILSFVFGTVADDSKLWDHFDLNLALWASAQTTVHRLATRAPKHNNFGQSAEEQQLVVRRMPKKLGMYRDMGAILINTEQQPEVVVNQILTFSLAIHDQNQRIAAAQSNG